jgi:hypothetical protein
MPDIMVQPVGWAGCRRRSAHGTDGLISRGQNTRFADNLPTLRLRLRLGAPSTSLRMTAAAPRRFHRRALGRKAILCVVPMRSVGNK